MSAPILWIFIPIVVSFFLFFLHNQRFLSVIIGGGTSALLALFALTFKIDRVFPLGPLSMEISSTFSVLGRNFIITDNERVIIVILFAMGAFWIFGSQIAGTNSFFPSIVVAIISLFIAALSVQPFLYAAFIIEIAVLLSIPIFLQRGQPVKQGILRFLIFQTLAVPLILFSGWGFEVAPSSVNSEAINRQSVILLMLGFGLWLSIFPFHTWLPLLSEDGDPYSAGFIFSMLSTAIFLFFLEFFNTFTWLHDQQFLFSIVLVLGTIMVSLGGLFAAFQQSITRLFGYAVMVEIGFSLLALGLNQEIGWRSYVLILLPRLLGIAICGLAIANWKKQNFTLGIDSFKGQFYKNPFSMIGFIVGWFIFCGLPLLPGFPTKYPILIGVAEINFNLLIFLMLGLFGLFMAIFRFLAVIFLKSDQTEQIRTENLLQKIFFSIGSILIILFGLFPGYLLTPFLIILDAFPNLK